MSTIRIDVPRERIEEFCRRWQITEMALFGSVLRDDFRPDSDVDVLVTFAQEFEPSLSDLLTMEEQLGEMLGRRIDLVRRSLVERNRNYIIRRDILHTARQVYATR